MARKALKNPSWEKQFRQERSNLRGYLNWHEAIEDQGGLTTRVLAGILSFGVSEVLAGGICAVGAAMDDTEEVIHQVKNCMIDMLRK
jgi:hypothetical protein